VTKRALCVGINNYPGTDKDLSGCVNDAKAWGSLLVEHYDFTRSDVVMLLDKKATHAAMIDGLKRLLANAKRGDVLVFTNSSHGTYVADDNADEPSYDEALCPWDAKDHLLVDDELRELFGSVPTGVRLTVVLDSCFSGTGTRRPHQQGPVRRPRFLPPARLGHRSINTRTATRRGAPGAESKMHELLLAACNDQQEASDADFPEGAQGAFTYYALKALAAAHYRMSYATLLTKVRAALNANEFRDQSPQLEGKAANKRRQAFT
jgi:metacaspase-1